MSLLGRRAECEALDGLLADVLAGRGRVAVLRGEAGVGKSALLGYVSGRVAGWRVATAIGVESEMELAYSGLHQLCAPMLDRLAGLPDPQRHALATVFGQATGPVPDRFLVGLGTLTLLSLVADEQPLICIVDDAQWLDQASAQILGFVGRRILAERIALVCAARTGIGDDVLAGLPELSIERLCDSEARALLLDNVHGPLDAPVFDQIVAESHGNPLALLELPQLWPADSVFPSATRRPARSNRATSDVSSNCPPIPSCSSSPRPQSPSATPYCSTVPPRSSASTSPRSALRSTPGCSDRKSTRLNSSHLGISYAVFC